MTDRQLWQAGFITLEEYLKALRESRLSEEIVMISKFNVFIKDGRCDHKFCPRKATRFVRDIEDIEMTRTPYLDGYLIKSQQQVGDIRRGCSWHPPAKSVYYKMEEEEDIVEDQENSDELNPFEIAPLRRTIGSKEWLDSLTDEQILLIETDIMSVYREYGWTRHLRAVSDRRG